VKPSSSVLQSTFTSSILTTNVSCTPCTGNFSVGCGCCSIVTSGTGSIAAIDEYSGLGEANMGISFISLHSSSSDDSIAPISSIFQSSELVASVVSMFFSLETTISFFSLLSTVSSSVGILSILHDFIASTSSIILSLEIEEPTSSFFRRLTSMFSSLTLIESSTFSMYVELLFMLFPSLISKFSVLLSKLSAPVAWVFKSTTSKE